MNIMKRRKKIIYTPVRFILEVQLASWPPLITVQHISIDRLVICTKNYSAMIYICRNKLEQRINYPCNIFFKRRKPFHFGRPRTSWAVGGRVPPFPLEPPRPFEPLPNTSWGEGMLLLVICLVSDRSRILAMKIDVGDVSPYLCCALCASLYTRSWRVLSDVELVREIGEKFWLLIYTLIMHVQVT